jgi:hypothetical protein
MEGFGSYNRQRATFEIECGFGDLNPKVYCRTAKEPDSVVGMTNVFGIWCDEAGKYPLYFWENIQGRAAFKDCPIMITTSPYSLNWIYKDLIKPVRAGTRTDTLLIQASSDENPFFPKEVFERNKQIMDPRRFNMMYNGNFDKMQGLVYDCFDEDENQCEPFKMPEGTKYYGGIDWGTTNPFVIKIRAITLDGRRYGVSEFYKSGLTPSDQIDVAKKKMEVFGVKQFYCDPSEPGLIADFCRNGIPAVAADNDITRGIGIHYELLASRKLKYFRGQNPYTLDELETYHYPEPTDLGPDENDKPAKPVASFNHVSDAERYLSISTGNLEKNRSPFVPEDRKKEETNQQRISRLMKKRSNEHSENWD